jgi:hypothetical protein
VGYLEAPLNLNPSDRETKTTMVTRVMLRVSSNQKDEVDAAFRYRIYRMAGILVKKRLPDPFLLPFLAISGH